MRSIFYRFPLLYDWGIRVLYFDGLKILRDIIGRKKSVFEPACGFGRMKKYIHSDCHYSGIDLNERFIKYGRRLKRDISLGNVLDSSRYRKADTILLCDILHHLKVSDIWKLFSIAAQFAIEKVVIVEPTFVKIASKNNFISRAIGKFMSVVDNDGFNQINHWMSRDEYNELFQSLKEAHNISEMRIRNHRNHDFVEMCIQREVCVKQERMVPQCVAAE
jgi:SAM-dependent methyltransferase